jgi:hypothetical protein
MACRKRSSTRPRHRKLSPNFQKNRAHQRRRMFHSTIIVSAKDILRMNVGGYIQRSPKSQMCLSKEKQRYQYLAMHPKDFL